MQVDSAPAQSNVSNKDELHLFYSPDVFHFVHIQGLLTLLWWQEATESAGSLLQRTWRSATSLKPLGLSDGWQVREAVSGLLS